MNHAIRLACLLVLAFAVPARAQDVTIHVIEPMSGNAAFVGKTHSDALRVLEAAVNKDGGIRGRPLKLVIHDDQTSPQVAVQITNEIMADKPAVMLGSSIVAMCSAELPLLRNGPFDYCFSPGMHPQPGSYMFSIGVDTRDLIQAVFRFLRESGITRIATITSTDATGQEMEQDFDLALKAPGNAALQLVSRNRFTIGDVSVSAQIERIREAKPQVVIAWTTGGAIANIFKGLLQAGIDVPVVTSNGNMANEVMAQFAAFLPKTLWVPATIYPEHDGLFTLDPRVEAKQHEFYALAKQAKLPIDYMTVGVWDPLLMVVEALRALGPDATAQQVRDWVNSQTHFAGISGLYDFSRVPQRGLDVNDALVTRWDAADTRWVPVAGPGGAKLP